MAGRKTRITASTWIETARRSLIEEGIAGVKVDRLASRLGVTRGGFYHNFKDRADLLAHWELNCRFLPDDQPSHRAADAIEWFDRAIARLIESDGYDHRYDLAVREWGRSSQRAAWAIDRVDRERLDVGVDHQPAVIRAFKGSRLARAVDATPGIRAAVIGARVAAKTPANDH